MFAALRCASQKARWKNLTGNDKKARVCSIIRTSDLRFRKTDEGVPF